MVVPLFRRDQCTQGTRVYSNEEMALLLEHRYTTASCMESWRCKTRSQPTKQIITRTSAVGMRLEGCALEMSLDPRSVCTQDATLQRVCSTYAKLLHLSTAVPPQEKEGGSRAVGRAALGVTRCLWVNGLAQPPCITLMPPRTPLPLLRCPLGSSLQSTGLW
jgi:hypothetical protein